MTNNVNYITNNYIIPHRLCILTFDEQPVVDHRLDVGVEQSGDVVTHLQVGDVDQGAGRRTQRLLAQDAHDQLAVLHNHLGRWQETRQR